MIGDQQTVSQQKTSEGGTASGPISAPRAQQHNWDFETPLLRLKRRFETKDQRKGDELTRITAKTGQTRTPHLADAVRNPMGVTR